MKVKELIKELESYNPEADITRPDSETICLSYICGENEFDASNTPLVFIEMCDFVEEDI